MLTDKDRRKLTGWHKHLYGKISSFELARMCKKAQINWFDAIAFLSEKDASIDCKGCQHNLGAKNCILYPCHSCNRRTAEKIRPKNLQYIEEKDYYKVREIE